MPIHRLDEEPTRQGILSDMTCDSDGRITHFIDPQGLRNTLALPPPCATARNTIWEFSL